MYSLELGTIEQTIAKQAMRAGEELPDRIAQAPKLRDGLDLYYSAFLDLDGERSHSLNLTPIPWSSMKTYAEFYEFDEEQAENLFFHIRRMDNAHLKRLDSKNG